MDTEGERQVVDRYLSALRDNDMPALAALFTDDVVVEWPQSGERFHGKESCVRALSSYPGGHPQFGDVTRTMGRDGLWLTETQATYPDGRVYRVIGVHEFRDGRIAHEVDYFAEEFEVPEWRRGWSEAG